MKAGISKTQKELDYGSFLTYSGRLHDALKENNVQAFRKWFNDFSADWVHFIWFFLDAKKKERKEFAEILLEHYPELQMLSYDHQWIELNDPANPAPKAELKMYVTSNAAGAVFCWLNTFSTHWTHLTPFLVEARNNKQIDIICLLIDRYPQFINSILYDENAHKRSILHWAALHGYIEIITMALRHKIKLEQYCEIDGETPLITAASRGQIEVVALLLQHGANVNARSIRYHTTALHCAASRGDVSLVTLLLKNGATQFYAGGSFEKNKLPIEIAKERRSVHSDREKEYDEIIALLEAHALKKQEEDDEKYIAFLEEHRLELEETSSESESLTSFPSVIFSQIHTSIVHNDVSLMTVAEVEETENIQEKRKITNVA